MTQPRAQTIIERTINAVGSVPSLIIHSVIFVATFSLSFFGLVAWNTMLLTLTTIISIEAIYLALFIQLSVNQNTASLREVEEDIDEIQEDVEELGEDVEDIQEDIEEISEDIDEIQEDVEEMSEEDAPAQQQQAQIERIEGKALDKAAALERLSKDLARVLAELDELKKGK